VTATNLLLVTLTGCVAFIISQFTAADQGIATETLSTVFSAGHTETLLVAVGNALGCGDLVIANVGEGNTAQGTVTAAKLVGEAAIMQPSCLA
jgi:hypothetical protein